MPEENLVLAMIPNHYNLLCTTIKSHQTAAGREIGDDPNQLSPYGSYENVRRHTISCEGKEFLGLSP